MSDQYETRMMTPVSQLEYADLKCEKCGVVSHFKMKVIRMSECRCSRCGNQVFRLVRAKKK